MTGMCHNTQPLFEMGFWKLFAQTGLKHDPFDLHLPNCLNNRLE
jgi:hypothetical protein